MSSFSTNDVIAGYRLEGQVGRGGMGVVYRATHVALERQGAVKLIAPDLAANQDFRLRFQRESRLAASIDHPHVIPVFDAGEQDGQLYVAMRYVEGTDLAKQIASRGSLAPEEAVEVIAQVADALDAAHDAGLVHRDVKPANVLLEERAGGRHAYLTDFGLVKTVGAKTGVLTKTGHFLGTPDYAAPEQIRGQHVDARADIYALGCMLYHAISGRPPFERDNDVAKLFAHMSDPPPTLSQARPGVSAELDVVVRRALAKEPSDRFERASELADAARQAVAVGAADPATPAARAPVSPAVPTAPAAPREWAPAAAPGADSSRPPRRSRLGLIAAGAALLLIAAAVALVVVGSGGDDDGGDGGGGGSGDAASSAAPAAIPAGNLTANPSFEENTDGWDVFEATVTREPADDAPQGEYVARVTATGSEPEYSVDDDPETVGSSRAGAMYTATAWVKATDDNDGGTICISLREGLEASGGEGPFAAASVDASAGEYRRVRVSYRAEASAETIGVHVFRAGDDLISGEAFLVDAITVAEGGAAGGGPPSPDCDV